MTSKADEYRSRAEEADSVARIETDQVKKSQWESVARQWRELAKQADEKRFGRRLS